MRWETFADVPPVEWLARPLDLTILVLDMLSVVVNTTLLVMLVRYARDPSRLAFSFSFKLILLMSVFDILTSISNTSSLVVRSVLGNQVLLHDRSLYCAVYGFLDIALSGQSSLMTILLAIERYLVIVRGTKLPPRVGWGLLLLLNLMVGAPLLANALNRDFVPDPTRTYCLPYGTIVSSLAEYATGLLFYLPMVVLLFSYTSIFLKVYCHEKDLMATTTTTTRIHLPNRRMAQRSLLLIGCYCMCYAPTVIFYTQYVFSGIYPIELLIGTPITINLTLLLNPLLVIVLHRDFATQLTSLFKLKHLDTTTTTTATATFPRY